MKAYSILALTVVGVYSLVSSHAKGYEKTMEVTAYCTCRACCGPSARGITASGDRAVGKLIAAPKKYPFGTIMTIPGYGRAVVKDRGGAIQEAGKTLSRGMHVGKDPVPVRKLKYDRLDVLMPTHREAKRWGCKIVTVKIENP